MLAEAYALRMLGPRRTSCSFAVVTLCSAIALMGCREEAIDSTPERAVETLVQRMQSVHGDPVLGKAAYELLATSSKENLVERARRASAASGRPVSPEEMVAPSRFSLRFEPEEFQAEVQGRFARVTVTGQDPSRELVEVRCVREQEGWRVILDLPPPPPIETKHR